MSGNSWVTLATNDSYSLGALVLAHSLKRAGTVHNLTVMVTPGVSTSMRNQLASAFNVVQEVNILDSKDEKNLTLLTRPELGVTFTKLHCWRLTQFSKCVFLDADVLVLRNCDELFEREELSAAPDVGWPDCFNSGVFVYRPSIETYNAIINLALSQGSFDGGDQGLLNQFFSDWATKDISRRLPFIYNMCSSATYSYLPAFKQFGQDVKIVHFIGSSKPWLQYLDSETRQVRPTLGSEHLQGYLQLWWDIFCNDVHSILTTDMAGLAGALSQLTLGVARSPEQSALEEHLRKQAWEHGNIDYMGRDSFDNIWRKICQTLSEPPPDPLPEQCDLPSQESSFTVCTVPQEVISDDVPLPSLSQAQYIPSEIKDAGHGINTSESKSIDGGATVLKDESLSKLTETVEFNDNISETQLICNVVDQNVSSSSSTVAQSTSILPSEQMCIVDGSCLKEIEEAIATEKLPGVVSSSDKNSEDTQVSSCLEHSETPDTENLSQGNIVAHNTPLILSTAPSQELTEVIKTNVPVEFPDSKPIDSIVDPNLSSELHCITSSEVSNMLVGLQAGTSIELPRQVCPPEPAESIAYLKSSPETAGLVQCETDIQNVQDGPHFVEGFQSGPPLSEVKEGESKSFDTTTSQFMRVIEPTPPTSPTVSLVPETIVSCETNVLRVDSSIPDTPPLDSHCSKTPLGTSEVTSITSVSPVPESSLPSGSISTNDPKAPIPPRRRHRPSQRGQRGKK